MRALRWPARSSAASAAGARSGLSTLSMRAASLQLLDLARQLGLRAGALLVAAHGVADLGQVARARGRHHRRLVGAVAHPDRGSTPPSQRRPSSARRGFSAWYSAVTPSSLKRAAMVPNTGISSAACGPGFLVALHLLGDVAQRVGAPLRSNLLMATNSAKSSMSIFSSWLAAPNSGVITYMGTSTCGTMAASPWPMPEVSTTTRSKPAPCRRRSRRAGRLADLAAEVARGQRAHEDALALAKGTVHGLIAFMRMRSPSSAPPLLRREGSIEMTATRSLSPWSRRRRRISSSVSEDLPAPPVPVMPSTGILRLAACVRAFSTSLSSALPFSSAVISWARARQFASPWPWMAARRFGRVAVRSWSQRITISPIMPARPMRWPSSGL
jgi:hypothetical protein